MLALPRFARRYRDDRHLQNLTFEEQRKRTEGLPVLSETETDSVVVAGDDAVVRPMMVSNDERRTVQCKPVNACTNGQNL